MSDDMQLALLTSDDLSWLASGEVSPISPLAPFAGLTEAPPQEPRGVTGFNDAGWEWAKSVLREPAARIRVVVPGSTHSLVQYFYGDGLPGRGMVGCWLEDDGLRVSFPWSNQDIASLTSQVLFQEPPESVDIDPVVLSADGLTALAAAVDAVRAQRFAGEVTEGPLTEYRFGRDDLDARLSAGTEPTDTMWLVSLFQMTGFGAGVGGGALDRGLGELHTAGFVSIEGDHWTPRPTLLSHASWWANPLPSISYEMSSFEAGSAVHHEHRIVIRGEGPLVTFHKDGGSPDVAPITVSAPSSLEYFDDLARAFERVAPDEPEWVHVLEPVEVRDLVDTMTVVTHLQPGQWYLLMDVEGPWARISDPSGLIGGWAPGEALHTSGEPLEEVSHTEPEPELIAPTWTASHVVPVGGMRSWSVPDGSTVPLVDLAAGVELEVVERRTDWARVRAENGWEAWLDGRRLAVLDAGITQTRLRLREPAPTQTPSAESASTSQSTDWLAVAAALAIGASAFLSWNDGFDVLSGFDIPAAYLLTFGVWMGRLSLSALLLVLSVVALGTSLAADLRRYRPFVGAFAVAIGTVYFVRVLAHAVNIFDFDVFLIAGHFLNPAGMFGSWLLVASGVVLLIRR